MPCFIVARLLASDSAAKPASPLCNPWNTILVSLVSPRRPNLAIIILHEILHDRLFAKSFLPRAATLVLPLCTIRLLLAICPDSLKSPESPCSL